MQRTVLIVGLKMHKVEAGHSMIPPLCNSVISPLNTSFEPHKIVLHLPPMHDLPITSMPKGPSAQELLLVFKRLACCQMLPQSSFESPSMLNTNNVCRAGYLDKTSLSSISTRSMHIHPASAYKSGRIFSKMSMKSATTFLGRCTYWSNFNIALVVFHLAETQL